MVETNGFAKNGTNKHANFETRSRCNLKQVDSTAFLKFSFRTLFDPCCNLRTFCDRFQNALDSGKVVCYLELGKIREQITCGKKCEIQEGGILQQIRQHSQIYLHLTAVETVATPD